MKFTVLTYNCFGSPVSRNRKERFEKIGEELVSLRPDVLCLQEVIFARDARILRRILHQAGYHVISSIGLFTNQGGILVASLLPVGKFRFIPFSDQGKWFSQQITDRILGKGYLQVELVIDSSTVTLCAPHSISIYKADSIDEQVSRQNQILELAHVVRNTPGSVIVAGDMNMDPRETIYREFLETAGLFDSLVGDMVTFSSENTHADPLFQNDFNTRLDYVFHSKDLRVQSRLVFDEPVAISGKREHLSDHFGIEATVTK